MIIALLVLQPASPLLPRPLPRVSTATTKFPHTIEEEEEALALLRYSARAREESVAQYVHQRARAREREEDDDDDGGGIRNPDRRQQRLTVWVISQ